MNKINIALVGATGLVGTMFLKILEENNLNIGNIRLFASKKSKGKKIKFLNQYYEVEELDSSSFDNTDFIFFSAGKDVSSKYASIAEKKGIVIDNSSCFRQEKDIPLVVPEINFSDIDLTKRKLIANPNCSTIQCVMCLNVIKKLYHLNKIVYSTYQAVSGSGIKGIFDYQSSLEGYPKEFYPYDISKNCIPQIGDIKENNFTEEENKMILETRKILHLPFLEVYSTCVRVPICYGHGVSVYVETEEDIEIDNIISLMKNSKGIVYQEIPLTENINNNDVYVGRIRKCNHNSLMFYCTSNNIRKGAAGNAFQIIKKIIEENLLFK